MGVLLWTDLQHGRWLASQQIQPTGIDASTAAQSISNPVNFIFCFPIPLQSIETRCSSTRSRCKRQGRPPSERSLLHVRHCSSCPASESARGNQTSANAASSSRPTRAPGSVNLLLSRLPGLQVSISGAVLALDSAIVMPDDASRQPMIGHLSRRLISLCLTPHGAGASCSPARSFSSIKAPILRRPGNRNRCGLRRAHV